eukprot:1261418-Amphidinium_carterae.1
MSAELHTQMRALVFFKVETMHKSRCLLRLGLFIFLCVGNRLSVTAVTLRNYLVPASCLESQKRRENSSATGCSDKTVPAWVSASERQSGCCVLVFCVNACTCFVCENHGETKELRTTIEPSFWVLQLLMRHKKTPLPEPTNEWN